MRKEDERLNEYRDGIGAARCLFCGTVKRFADEADVVSVRVSDIESLIVLLVQNVAQTDVWGETQKRLEQAVGRSVRQILSSRHAEPQP